MIKDYDTLIQAATAEHLAGVDWRLIKAQLFAESSLNPDAMSRSGAQGIAQFMPATWSEVAHDMRLDVTANPFDPAVAIPACCFYMKQLYDKWTAPRPDADRYALTLSSYNAGFGNLIEAQKIANGANAYYAIVAQLHHLTGDQNSAETLNYVKRIFDIFQEQLLWGS